MERIFLKVRKPLIVEPIVKYRMDYNGCYNRSNNVWNFIYSESGGCTNIIYQVLEENTDMDNWNTHSI